MLTRQPSDKVMNELKRQTMITKENQFDQSAFSVKGLIHQH